MFLINITMHHLSWCTEAVQKRSLFGRGMEVCPTHLANPCKYQWTVLFLSTQFQSNSGHVCDIPCLTIYLFNPFYWPILWFHSWCHDCRNHWSGWVPERCLPASRFFSCLRESLTKKRQRQSNTLNVTWKTSTRGSWYSISMMLTDLFFYIHSPIT